MSVESDLRGKLAEIFGATWVVRDGHEVPEAEDVTLGKDAVRLEGTVLYADLVGSTGMVQSKKPEFAAEVYKAFLDSACRLIRAQGGAVTSFDGDRVMAVFIGRAKNTAAATTALNINWAVTVINDVMKKKWTTDMVVKQCVGIDTGKLFVAKTGIRGSNDLVWVGRAANYAAKLSEQRSSTHASWITSDVFAALDESVKYSSTSRESMWERDHWAEQGITVYKSTWWRAVK